MTNTTAVGRTLPIRDSLTEPFWHGAARHELLLPISPETKQLSWPPTGFPPLGSRGCPDWKRVTGKGVVYTFSIVYRSTHPRPPVPYVLAVVLLEEGVYMTTNIVQVEPERVYIGMPVTVVFEPLSDGFALPVFTPA